MRVLALAWIGLAAGPAAAEIRRFEVVGAVTLDPAAPPAAPRQAALRAALREAVTQAAREILGIGSGAEAPGEDPPPPAVPGEPSEYAVSYRVLEDRGEQPAPGAGAEGGREYVVVAEVQIDIGRVREVLGATDGLPATASAPAGGPASFRLELLGIPGPAAWTAIRGALARAGAASVPLEIEPGRALLEVESGLGADQTLERLLQAAPLPGGLGLESLPEESGVRRLQVREGIPPQAPPELLVD